MTQQLANCGQCPYCGDYASITQLVLRGACVKCADVPAWVVATAQEIDELRQNHGAKPK